MTINARLLGFALLMEDRETGERTMIYSDAVVTAKIDHQLGFDLQGPIIPERIQIHIEVDQYTMARQTLALERILGDEKPRLLSEKEAQELGLDEDKIRDALERHKRWKEHREEIGDADS